MKKIFNTILVLAVAVAASSCSDWLKSEPISVKTVTIQDTNPELYAKYLEAVKEYKNSDHTIVLASFDNSAEVVKNPSQSLLKLPEYLDYIELIDIVPNDLTKADMKTVRDNYGTKFLARISYDAVVADTTTTIEEAVENFFEVVRKYKYDGIIIEYEGKLPDHLLDSELTPLKEKENSFLPLFTDWLDENGDDMVVIFNGTPNYTVDHTVPLAADYIMIKSRDFRSPGASDFAARQAAVDDFEDANMIFEVYTMPYDDTDIVTGQYFEGEALPLLADWMTTSTTGNYNKAGMMIYNVERDCFHVNDYYVTVKNAIKTINPNS